MLNFIFGIETNSREFGEIFRIMEKQSKGNDDKNLPQTAEEKLRRAERRIENILESFSDAFFTADRDWRFTYINRHAEQILGRPADELLGKNMWEEFPEAVETDIYNHYQKAVAEHITVNFETFYPPFDAWFEVRAYPSHDGGLSVYFHNISDRKHADAVLRESEERYRILAETASDAIIRIDANSTIEYTNTAVESIFGYTAEELIGQPLTMLMPEELRQRHLAGFAHYLKTGKKNLNWHSIEVPAQHKDGHHFPLEISFGEYHHGSRRFFIGIARDITGRKRAEDKLRESEEQLRALADSIPQLAWMAEPDGFIFWYNRRWYDYTGTTPEEMAGWGWQNVHDEKILPDVLQRWQSSIRTGEPFEMEFPLRRGTDGAFRWFLTRVFPLRDSNGNIVRWFGTNTDIEELRQTRLQAEQANRLKDEFLATLSHELRTPLNAILGWSKMLQTNNLGEDGAKKAIATIERNARSQNQLIEDLLDVSRIITGKLRLDIRAVDLPNVITAAIDAVRPAAEAKNIHLQILIDPQAGPISGDPDRLQQIVWNLLSNAVKFTPKNGRIQIRLERINSHIEIVVSDTGKGIEPEFLPNVFDRFSQSDGSMTRRHGGLGLGLAIVRQLVELHGGTVSVESDGSEQGTTFTISLPLLSVRREPAGDVPRIHPKAAESSAGLECPPELTDLRVLLVEDEADSRELVNMVLEECGAEVVTAESAAEAFAAIERGKISYHHQRHRNAG